MVQWLGLCTFIAEVTGSIPGQGTKIPHGQKKKKKAGSFFGEINEMTGTNPQRKLVGCSGGLEPVVVNCLVSELIVS